MKTDREPRVLNRRDLPKGSIPENAVYVGRPSKWGNPFVLDVSGTRREGVVAAYRRWIKHSPLEGQARAELRGKDLVCWCAPESCHADVLLEIANADEQEDAEESLLSEYLREREGK